MKTKEQIERKYKLLRKRVDFYNNPEIYKSGDPVLNKEYAENLEKYWNQYIALRWVLGR